MRAQADTHTPTHTHTRPITGIVLNRNMTTIHVYMEEDSLHGKASKSVYKKLPLSSPFYTPIHSTLPFFFLSFSPVVLLSTHPTSLLLLLLILSSPQSSPGNSITSRHDNSNMIPRKATTVAINPATDRHCALFVCVCVCLYRNKEDTSTHTLTGLTEQRDGEGVTEISNMGCCQAG